ncbi:MAG: dihydroneopterin aldolase [Chloroflexi bacterium]|nr:dihydroneopterin aldolase [Chloroflexota bacterium]
MPITPDLLLIEGLRFQCTIGVHEWEALVEQEVFVDLKIETDTRAAAGSDDLSKAVNYSEVVAAIQKLISGRPFKLIETMSEKIAQVVLDIEGVNAATVKVSKPSASKIARNVAIEITRHRGTD